MPDISIPAIWLTVGFAGQALFSMRFLVQWIASERAHRSVIPKQFWYLSLAGGLTLLAYAIHRQDPVFILGQTTGAFIYGRNLWLIATEQAKRAAETVRTAQTAQTE